MASRNDDGGEMRAFAALLLVGGLGVGAWLLLQNQAGQAGAAVGSNVITPLPGVLSSSLDPGGITGF